MTRVVGGLTLWLDHPDEVIPDRLRGTCWKRGRSCGLVSVTGRGCDGWL